MHNEVPSARRGILRGKKTPDCNTGLTIGEFSVRPDWLTIIFPDMCKVVGDKDKIISVMISFGFFEMVPGGSVVLPDKPGRHRYKTGFYIKDPRGKEIMSVLYGGNKDTVRVEVTGTGCSKLSERSWWAIYVLALRYGGYITRYDLAGDDFAGKLLNPRKIRRDYGRCYKSIFPQLAFSPQVPKPTVIDSPKGYTCQLGTENMMVNHIIYEKGKESRTTVLGRNNPNWIRWEVRYKRRKNLGYEIDLDVLRPDFWVPAYFGDNAYLKRLLQYTGDSRRFLVSMPNEKRELVDSFWHCMQVLRDQYGRIVKDGRRLMGDGEFLEHITQADGHLLFSRLTQSDLLGGGQ